MPIEEYDFQSDLLVDKHSLDRQWEEQPMLYMKWAEAQAQAQLERDQAKERLEVVRAKLDGEARTNPSTIGGDKKVTEAAISAWVIMQKTYAQASDDLIQANVRMNLLAAAREAMNHRRAALENLTRLILGGYYSSPSIPTEARDAAEVSARGRQHAGLQESPRLRRK